MSGAAFVTREGAFPGAAFDPARDLARRIGGRAPSLRSRLSTVPTSASATATAALAGWRSAAMV